MKVELYLEDPMKGGCGCSASMKDRMALVKRIREESVVWEKVKKQGKGEYTRVVLSRLSSDKYPPHVSEAVESGAELPYVFVDEDLVHSGGFPSLDEFKQLVGGT